MKIKSLFVAVGVIGLLVSGGASADWSWTFPPNVEGNYQSAFSRNSTPSGTSVTATGWANTGDVSGSDRKLVQGSVGLWSGLGVKNKWESGTSPNHSTDNSGRVDSILLSFTQAITLSQVKFGWVGGHQLQSQASDDSDFTLAYFKGDDGANNKTDLTNLTYATLADHGWSTIGSYYDPGTSTTSVNSGEKSSSFWLVSALNTKMGGVQDGTYDFVKLESVSAKVPRIPPPVPEPSTISLLLLGLLMAGYLSSQKRQRAAGRLAA